MKQGIQSTLKDYTLEKYGCYFLDLLEYAGWQDESETAIRAIYDRCLAKRFIQGDCYVINPVGIINEAAGKPLVEAVTRTSTMPTDEQFIMEMERPGHTHFVLNRKGQVWDSLDPNRPWASTYRPVSYRRFL